MDTTRTWPVGRKRKTEPNSERVDLRSTPSWLERVEEAARRKGLNLSSYIRMVVSERMDSDGVPDQAAPKPRKPKPD